MVTRVPELAITIERDGAVGDITAEVSNFYKFFLQSEDLLITHKRTPIVSSLPGSDPIILDLGQWVVDIKVEGVADIPVYMNSSTGIIRHREKKLSNPDGTTGDIPIADKDDLESIASPNTSPPWYDQEIRIKDYSYTYGIRNPAVYIVKIESISINKRGVNNFYNFIIQASGLLEPK